MYIGDKLSGFDCLRQTELPHVGEGTETVLPPLMRATSCAVGAEPAALEGSPKHTGAACRHHACRLENGVEALLYSRGDTTF